MCVCVRVCYCVYVYTHVGIGNTKEAREGTSWPLTLGLFCHTLGLFCLTFGLFCLTLGEGMHKLARDPGKDFFDTKQNAKTKMLLHLRTGSILVVFIVDAIGLLVLQLPRRCDFMCTEEPPGRHVHKGNLGLLVVILLMHAIYILDAVFRLAFFARRETSICWQVCLRLWSECTTRFLNST
jgi:hypothetical protein